MQYVASEIDLPFGIHPRAILGVSENRRLNVYPSEVVFRGVQTLVWQIGALEIHSLALNLNVINHQFGQLSNSFKPGILYFGDVLPSTQPEYHESSALSAEIYSSALNLGIMSYQLCMLSDSQGSKSVALWQPLIEWHTLALNLCYGILHFGDLLLSTQPEYHVSQSVAPW